MLSLNVHAVAKHRILLLLLIVLCAVGLRVKYAAGFIPKDDAEFAKVAYQMYQGTFDYEEYDGPPVIPTRVGIVLPTAAAMAAFGVNEISIAVYPLLSSVALLILIYLFTRRAFGHYAACVASAIWIFLPMELEISTMLWPEVPATLFAFLGVYFIYIARLEYESPGRRLVVFGLLSGLAFGLSWLCKATVVYFVPFCLLVMIIDLARQRVRLVPLWAAVAVGSLLVLGTEMAVYSFLNGDWLYRFDAIERNYRLYSEFFFVEGARFGYEVGVPFWQAVVKRVFIDGPQMIFLQSHFLYLPTFGLLAAAYAVYKKETAAYFFVLLFAMLVVVFDAFSISTEGYQPLPLFSRYFYPICIPAVILTGGLIAGLTRSVGAHSQTETRLEQRFWGGIIVAVLILIVSWSQFRMLRDDIGTWSAAEKELAGTLTPTDRIYTDALSRNSLEFFWRYPQTMNVISYSDIPAAADLPCGSYVLNNLSYNNWLSVNTGTWLTMKDYAVPPQIAAGQADWRKVWTNANATLYSIDCK